MQWKNSTAPGNTQHRLIVFAKHLLIWVIWYGVSSLVLIEYRQPLTAVFWGHLCYDFSSLVLVFYGVAFLVKQWFDAQHRRQLYVPPGGNGYWRQAATAWWTVLTILTGYVALSVFVDINFPIDEPASLLDYIDKRLIRVLPYIAAAIMYGHYRSEAAWYEVLLADASVLVHVVEDQFKQYSSFSQRLRSEGQAALTDTLYRPTQWKNNMPATTAPGALAIIARHTLLWVAWFVLHSLSLMVYAPTFTALDWLLSLYDYCSIVLVFYGARFFITKYLRYQQHHSASQLSTRRRLRQLLRIALFGVLVILGSYIALSVYLSQRFPYEGSPAISSYLYAWRYFDYALPYVMIATLHSYFTTRIHLKRVELKKVNFWGQKVVQQNEEMFLCNEELRSLYMLINPA
jgi:hypothetical protein